MASSSRPHAPRVHRLLIWFLASLLALLFYWALNFVVSDIGGVDGPLDRAKQVPPGKRLHGSG